MRAYSFALLAAYFAQSVNSLRLNSASVRNEHGGAADAKVFKIWYTVHQSSPPGFDSDLVVRALNEVNENGYQGIKPLVDQARMLGIHARLPDFCGGSDLIETFSNLDVDVIDNLKGCMDKKLDYFNHSIVNFISNDNECSLSCTLFGNTFMCKKIADSDRHAIAKFQAERERSRVENKSIDGSTSGHPGLVREVGFLGELETTCQDIQKAAAQVELDFQDEGYDPILMSCNHLAFKFVKSLQLRSHQNIPDYVVNVVVQEKIDDFQKMWNGVCKLKRNERGVTRFWLN